MEGVPLWLKIVFTIWVFTFIVLEATWESIWDWIKEKSGINRRHEKQPAHR